MYCLYLNVKRVNKRHVVHAYSIGSDRIRKIYLKIYCYWENTHVLVFTDRIKFSMHTSTKSIYNFFSYDFLNIIVTVTL